MEQKFKDILKEHEVAYDPKAWENLSEKLDHYETISKSSNSWKWMIWSLSSLILTIGCYVYFSDNNKPVSSVVEIQKTVTKPKKRELFSDDDETQAPQNKSSKRTVLSEKSLNEANDRQALNIPAEDHQRQLTVTEDKNDHLLNELQESDRGLANKSKNEDSSPTLSNVSFPYVSNLCQGETVSIQNKNDVSIFLSDLNSVIELDAGKQFKLTTENPGKYFFGQRINGKIIYSDTPGFIVKNKVQVSIEVGELNRYENGIPTTHLHALAEDNCTFTWKINGVKHGLYGKDAKVHFYQKGNYEVELLAESKENGCTTIAQKSIAIQEDYNLLAVNSFWPNSNNPSNASFMPYALKERNVDFKLTIIDPSNGSILFETNDVTNGWTGINRTNGQLVESNKAFVWIVQLKNPLPGEKSEYKGTILRMP